MVANQSQVGGTAPKSALASQYKIRAPRRRVMPQQRFTYTHRLINQQASFATDCVRNTACVIRMIIIPTESLDFISWILSYASSLRRRHRHRRRKAS